MPKLDFTLGILVLPFVFLSLEAQTTETKVGTATVSGRVTLKSESARGVVVVLQSEDAMRSGDRSPGLRMKTDENGRFRFASVKAGRYTLAAIAPGFITPVENTLGGVRIVIGHGTNVVRGQLRLTGGALPEGASLIVNANCAAADHDSQRRTALLQDRRERPYRFDPGRRDHRARD